MLLVNRGFLSIIDHDTRHLRGNELFDGGVPNQDALPQPRNSQLVAQVTTGVLKRLTGWSSG